MLIQKDGTPSVKTRIRVKGNLYALSGERLRFQKGKSYGWLNRTGDVAIEPTFGWGDDFVGDYAMAGERPTAQGLIDLAGRYRLPPIFFAVRPTLGGLVCVFPDAKRRATFGYVTPKGEWIWQPSKGFGRTWVVGGCVPKTAEE